MFVDGIHLVTKLRKNMKRKALDFMDKIYFRKTVIIEYVNDVLKNTYPIENYRHRSFDNFSYNLITGLTAYSFLNKNPSIKTQRFLPNIGKS